jgi:predicted AlkP superfamily phosphohydrolase/phosphomutase
MDKVLVLGIDAMDPRIFESLKSKLPNFSSLKTYHELKTTVPPETPVAWSAASTGTNPGKYGIFDFINRDPETYLPKLNLAEERPGLGKTEYICAMKGEPFWKILNENGIKTTVIRWPVTFPAEKIDGRMLSGLGVVDLKGLLNSYSFYTDDEKELEKEGKEKVVLVDIKEGRIETYLSGPLARKGNDIVDVRTPIKIKVDGNKITISVDGKDYELEQDKWSEIIKVKFKVGMFREISGILNFHLISTAPFKLYASSVQIDPEDQVVDITHPKDYGKELVEKIGPFYTLGMPEDTKAVTEEKMGEDVFLQQVNQIEEERRKIFFYELDRFEKGLYAFAFDSGDRLKHIFWDRGIPKEIEDYYVEKDKFLGEVLKKLGDTKLIIFSDHGFSSFEKQVNLNSWLVKEGYMEITSDDGSLFEFVNWSKTKAYSLGFTSVYLNLKDREGKGIVEQAEKNKLIDEIVFKLKDLRDGGKKVFTEVYKGTEIYTGEYSYLAPDIVVGFSIGYRMSWRSAVGALDKEIISENKKKWKGDHLIDRSHVPGVLFTNFEIKKANPEITDIAPTVLALFGVEIPDNMDGRSLV